MDAPTTYQGPANTPPRLPAGQRTWDSTRYGGRLHVVDAEGKAHIAPTRADQEARQKLPSGN